MKTLLEQGNSVWFALIFVAVAVLCMFTQARAELDRPLYSRASGQWRWRAVLLWLVAANLLIHGDIMFVALMREVARSGGWYETRRPLQVGTLVILMAAGTFAYQRMSRLTLLSNAADRSLANRTAGVGTLLLLLVVSLRFISLHHADQVLNTRLFGASLGRWFELTGLALIGGSAFSRMFWYRSARP